MSGFKESSHARSSDRSPLHWFPLDCPATHPPSLVSWPNKQCEAWPGLFRMRGAAQLPQDDIGRRRFNPRGRAEANSQPLSTSHEDTLTEGDVAERPVLKTNFANGARLDRAGMSFHDNPLRLMCMELWDRLDNAMQLREKAIEEKEIEIAHSLSVLKAQTEMLARERLHVEKLKQEADFIRERALNQTKSLENQIAQLKKMKLDSSQNMVKVLLEREEIKRADSLEGATTLGSQVREAEIELDGLLAKEPISLCNSMTSPVDMIESYSNQQGATTTHEEKVLHFEGSEVLLKDQLDGNLHPQKSVVSSPKQQAEECSPKVKIEPADESCIASRWCVKEGSVLKSNALPEITVFLDTDPGLDGDIHKMKTGKSEVEAESCEDMEDVPLAKRRKLLRSNKSNDRKIAEGDPSVSGKIAAESRCGYSKKSLSSSLPAAVADFLKTEGKRKNVSMETALQEDAPGLLEALRENGLYEDVQTMGRVWEDGSEELKHENEDFEELEGIMSKVWGASSGLFKESRIRSQLVNNGSKPSYCMPSLVSLIEQTRAFQVRKWPVEWGWCRQLCAFLFVFENHNRIVLERPEYGYATYFFELVQDLPVRWQVQRVIKVMSVTNNCRAALVENRALEVGVDLEEEEAAIMEDYGWIRNSGIASLLNFCDRVAHDYKRDEMIDWRSKIGKLLMDGHDHGRIISRIPRKFQDTNKDMKSSSPACANKAIVGTDFNMCMIKEEMPDA